jgi:hypothetical protein
LKKIWFTEYGFPSVDLASNQPNVFYSKDSVEGGLPYNSQGYSDVQAQRTAIVATEEYWQTQNDMVERLFLWTWDARPYPAWPSLGNIWADAYAWDRGHWVQGKLDTVMLGEICSDLCAKAGLPVDKLDLGFLGQSIVQWFFLNRQISLRNAISYLQQAYFFSIRENKGKIQFIDLKRELPTASIPTGQLVPSNYFAHDHIDVLQISQKAERTLPQNIVLNYIDATSNYTASNIQAHIENVEANLQQTISLPIVTSPYHARQIAYINLHAKWYCRLAYSFMLPLSYLPLKPLDIVKLTDNSPKIRISKIFLGKNNTIEIRGYADEPNIYHCHSSIQHTKDNFINNFADSNIEILDIPNLPFEQYSPAKGRIFIAACGETEGWLGCALKLTTSEDALPIAQIKVKHPATMGKVLQPAGEASPYLLDQKSKMIVNMQQGKLHSLPTSLAEKNYNLALIGDEIIQFKYARLLQEDQYELSELFRGLCGTEQFISSHTIGERFILLEQSLPQIELDNNYLSSKLLCYSSNSEQPIEFNYLGVCHREYAPAHLTIDRKLDGSLQVSWVGRTKATDNWHQFGSNINEAQYLLQLEYQNGEINELWVEGAEYILSPQQVTGLSSLSVAQISPQFGAGEKVSFRF